MYRDVYTFRLNLEIGNTGEFKYFSACLWFQHFLVYVLKKLYDMTYELT